MVYSLCLPAADSGFTACEAANRSHQNGACISGFCPVLVRVLTPGDAGETPETFKVLTSAVPTVPLSLQRFHLG
jgi:hypothetical protein